MIPEDEDEDVDNKWFDEKAAFWLIFFGSLSLFLRHKVAENLEISEESIAKI